MTTLSKAQSEAKRGKRMRVFLEPLAYRLSSLMLLIVVWKLTSVFVSTKYIPDPLDTWNVMMQLFIDGEFASNYAATLIRMLVSFAASMLIGLVVGIVMGLYNKAERMLDLWVMVGLGVPGLCYVVVCFMALGLNDKAAIVAITLTTFPTIAINMWQGVKSIDQRLIDMARSFQANSLRRTVHVVLPQVLPYLVAASRFGLGMIWKVTVLVELLGMSDGVGYKINYSFQMLNMTGVFAWTLSFTLLMLVIELGVFAPLERRLFSWRPEIRR